MEESNFSLGYGASLVRAVSADDFDAFAALSGDTNPVHLDDAYAATTRFGRRIAHGMLVASYISTLLGTRFPGTGTIYLSQTLSFLRPVFVGDTLTVSATVTAYRPDKAIVTLATLVVNQTFETVVKGEAVCMVRDVPALATKASEAIVGGVAAS